MKHLGVVACFGVWFGAVGLGWSEAPKDKRLQGSWREKEHNGWIRVHLEGTPADIGLSARVPARAGNRRHAPSLPNSS